VPAGPLTTWEKKAGEEPWPRAHGVYRPVGKLRAKKGWREQAKDQGSQRSNCEGARAQKEKNPCKLKTTHIET